MTSAYKQAEPWEVSTGKYLPEGDWVVKVESVEDGTSSGGYPMLTIELANEQGTLRDWIVITPATLGKVTTLANAVGVEPPEEGEYDNETYRLSPAWIKQLEGKQVGVVARDEPSNRDPAKTFVTVQGYLSVERIKAAQASDVTSGKDFAEQDAERQSGSFSDDPIPF